MPEQGQPPDFGVRAQRAADRLAIALEEIGFDVGRAFPMLSTGIDARGGPGVELGRVTAAVAERLSTVLLQAVRCGVMTPAGDDWPEDLGPSAGHDPAAGH